MITIFGRSPQNGRLLLFLGITKHDHEVMPRRIFAHHGDQPMGVQDIFVIYGDTRRALLRKFEEAGLTIPQNIKDKVAQDPPDE